MKTALSLLIIFLFGQGNPVRVFVYHDKNVETTWKVNEQFYGKYSGSKSGYLELKKDGTGFYKYDYFAFAMAGCKNMPIEIQWGFLLDENGEIVRHEREYGFSYPILYKSTGEVSFRGCREEMLLDFLMVYKNGNIGVSSSDDWVLKK